MSSPQPARQSGFQAGGVTGAVGRRPRYEAVGTHQQAAHPGAVRTTPDQLQTPGVRLGQASALETGPASLYAHVVNKEDLDDLLIGRLCAEIELPKPNPRTWREQIISVCTQIRDQYLRYPGISLAALAVVPTNLETLRVSEGMLGIVLAGGVDPQTAAWAIDALFLSINAFCLETSLIDRHVDQEGWAVSRDELLRRSAALPDTFPYTKRYAAELTSGTALDRFEFTLNLMMGGLGNRN